MQAVISGIANFVQPNQVNAMFPHQVRHNYNQPRSTTPGNVSLQMQLPYAMNHSIPALAIPPQMKLRRGKWTAEEENYANRLIEEFERGTVTDCENGCTLRAFLSRKLHCAPMRISKKFAGKSIGKHVFLSRGTGSGFIDQNKVPLNSPKLRELEQLFYSSLFQENGELRNMYTKMALVSNAYSHYPYNQQGCTIPMQRPVINSFPNIQPKPAPFPGNATDSQSNTGMSTANTAHSNSGYALAAPVRPQRNGVTQPQLLVPQPVTVISNDSTVASSQRGVLSSTTHSFTCETKNHVDTERTEAPGASILNSSSSTHLTKPPEIVSSCQHSATVETRTTSNSNSAEEQRQNPFDYSTIPDILRGFENVDSSTSCESNNRRNGSPDIWPSESNGLHNINSVIDVPCNFTNSFDDLHKYLGSNIPAHHQLGIHGKPVDAKLQQGPATDALQEQDSKSQQQHVPDGNSQQSEHLSKTDKNRDLQLINGPQANTCIPGGFHVTPIVSQPLIHPAASLGQNVGTQYSNTGNQQNCIPPVNSMFQPNIPSFQIKGNQHVSADAYALFAQQSVHAVSQHSAYCRSDLLGGSDISDTTSARINSFNAGVQTLVKSSSNHGNTLPAATTSHHQKTQCSKTAKRKAVFDTSSSVSSSGSSSVSKDTSHQGHRATSIVEVSRANVRAHAKAEAKAHDKRTNASKRSRSSPGNTVRNSATANEKNFLSSVSTKSCYHISTQTNIVSGSEPPSSESGIENGSARSSTHGGSSGSSDDTNGGSDGTSYNASDNSDAVSCESNG